LPPAGHSNGPSTQRKPANSAGNAGGPVYRGALAGASEDGGPRPCTGPGAPYPRQVESLVLRSALTPFVRFEIEGYVRSCVDQSQLELRAGDSWKAVATALPRRPATSLDGTPLGADLCDVVSCMKIEHPVCVALVDFERLDSQTNAYRSRPLHGEVRVQFPYYADSGCHSPQLAVQRVVLP
jgi:hypothetical protein